MKRCVEIDGHYSQIKLKDLISITINNMSHLEKRLNDIRYKIRTVKENRNTHFRYPREIITTLTMIEMTLEDKIFNSRITH